MAMIYQSRTMATPQPAGGFLYTEMKRASPVPLDLEAPGLALQPPKHHGFVPEILMGKK
jgi:hypothetical protein